MWTSPVTCRQTQTFCAYFYAVYFLFSCLEVNNFFQKTFLPSLNRDLKARLQVKCYLHYWVACNEHGSSRRTLARCKCDGFKTAACQETSCNGGQKYIMLAMTPLFGNKVELMSILPQICKCLISEWSPSLCSAHLISDSLPLQPRYWAWSRLSFSKPQWLLVLCRLEGSSSECVSSALPYAGQWWNKCLQGTQCQWMPQVLISESR